MKRFFLVCLLLSYLPAFTQTPNFATAGDIYLGIKKLNVAGSVLYIAAHPDDENTRLLTYLSKEKLYRTGYLSITRGDGGQNLVGEEQGVELGLIRTQELLAARRIDGAEQFFTRAYDFGYSKSPEETFTKWDKEKVLSDVVWVIRKFQPDVIITRFPTTGEGGHGHHTASAILAVEAFSVAADAKRFPEQLKYVQPWQAKRILWNTFNFGGNNTTNTDQFKIDAGGFNPVIGKSYGEIAADSRSQHKSQGFGVPRARGEAIEFFKTIGGTPPVNDLFDGIDVSLARNGNDQRMQHIQAIINKVTAEYDFLAPQKAVSSLIKIYKEMQAAGEMHKLNELQNLVEAASGLWMEIYAPTATVAQGDTARIYKVLNNRLGLPVTLHAITANSDEATTVRYDSILPKNKNLVFAAPFSFANNYPVTQPYWLKENKSEGYFNVSRQELIGRPDVQPALTWTFDLSFGGERMRFTKPLQYKFTDPVKGERYQPFVVLPAIEFNYSSENYFLFDGKPTVVQAVFKANKKDSGLYDFQHVFSKNFKSSVPSFSFNKQNNAGDFARTIFTAAKKELNHKEQIFLQAKDHHGLQYQHKRIQIRYDHIPWINYFPVASANLVSVDVKTEGKKIGYIIGAGDKVPEALEQMGYEVILLTNKELVRNNLQQFDAIISGVRAYNTNDWLNAHYNKLMKYVEDGGNLIVQYNTSNQIGPVKAKMGPYNFGISRNRITDENAAVTFIKPGHPVFNFPNKITQDDFKDWIQERSIYHAENWDSKYEPVIRMNDPGEAPNDGSLLIAKHGKGFFTYTGLVFFRQLPAGVPGAYRLLANLIALNKIKGS